MLTAMIFYREPRSARSRCCVLVECTYLVSADHRSVSVQCPNISALSSQSISKCSTKERPSRRHLELDRKSVV